VVELVKQPLSCTGQYKLLVDLNKRKKGMEISIYLKSSLRGTTGRALSNVGRCTGFYLFSVVGKKARTRASYLLRCAEVGVLGWVSLSMCQTFVTLALSI
jgi:hypothetical protein